MKFRLCFAVACSILAANVPTQASDITGCFARSYDAAHMAKYPGQTPTMLGVLLSREDGNLIVSLTAKLRGKTGIWGEAGGCTADGANLRCSIDCDGGGFALTPDGDTITLTNQNGFRLSQTSCEGEAENITVEAVPGNRMFKLRKVEEKVCE